MTSETAILSLAEASRCLALSLAISLAISEISVPRCFPFSHAEMTIARLTFFTAWLICFAASRTALEVSPVGPPKLFLISTTATVAPRRDA